MSNRTITNINLNFQQIVLSLLYLSFSTQIFSQSTVSTTSKEISKSIYLTANIGLDQSTNSADIIQAIIKASQSDDKAVFLALGNTTRKNGYPKDKNDRSKEEAYLRSQLLEPLKNFNGELIFIPGKNEWNKGGHKNLDDLESFLQDNSTSEFWPNDGCPLERETLSDEVELVMVDTQWFLEDWDNYPYINNDCEIKTREQFFIEFKDELKDEQNKTIVVALHHPVLTATNHGLIGRMGGLSKQAYYNNNMQYLIGRLETLASQFNDVIFVSGSDRNLQFLMDDGIPQIISGATGKTSKSRPDTKDGHFGSDEPGFAKLNIFKDGSSEVEIYTVKNNQSNKVFTSQIKLKKGALEDFDYHTNSDFGETYKSSIYTEKETNKSGFYKWFWGDHYRETYGRKIEAPVLFLDSLPNNVRAITEGGGNQSRSLRLIDDNENEFTARELRKSGVRFIQSFIKDHYVIEYADNTAVETLVQDYYTTAQPYAQFVINDLLDAIDIPHANPKIVYLPKQERLGRFNENYGDKLYMYEEHVGDENKSFETFGNADDIISTKDMLLELQNDKDAKIDEDSYLRARLFDLLIGDWDRHADQWRWALHEKEDGVMLYKPIPRDRDQAFPKYDGVFPAILKLAAPLARNMQTYAPEIQNIKTFNNAVYYLDKNFINHAQWEDWKKQAEQLQNNLTDEVIDNAFANLLEDTKDQSTEKIKSILKQRRENIVSIAKDYYQYFKEHEIIVATNKDNTIDIVRLPNGKTNVTIRQKDKTLINNTYSKDLTKELWIYALDGNDDINITGDGDDYIHIKIFGGEENDIYNVENKRAIKVYDYKSKKNTFNSPVRKMLTDAYDINHFDPQKRKYSNNVVLPTVGFDPDAGFNAGITNTFTTYSLLRNPFTTQHTLNASYYSATQGFEFSYIGEFAHIFQNWNLNLDTRITSANFATNFFGIGNETVYDEDDKDMDFNRVKIKQWHIQPSLIYRSSGNVSAHVAARIEAHEVENSDDGITETMFSLDDDVFDNQIYAGAEVGINFNNKEGLLSLPRRGMELGLVAGYKQTIDSDYDNKFSYITPTASFIFPIHESGLATLATKAQANFILGDNYEFYHAATVGGNTSLRGYRNERFSGETSFFQTTDLRVCFLERRTGFVPLRIGVTGGFDYGRVWNENEDSSQWHNSYGGSIFINGFQAFTANVGYYQSNEDSRIIFTAGFRF
ncbi:metallophosphatase [Winogradskyella bathintestinalis]|uniref:Metallophosphatase n=1 Tax=Winogradskyella bathintestinalis TaxID=3035208 RepID=A0ABT7ZUR3_9FLAO|nr:metallophosphatase [Winogradskyella bathintestinalis]MDN3492549.1 metallophosphatase [Winogradskyella bathintestinalis]